MKRIKVLLQTLANFFRFTFLKKPSKINREIHIDRVSFICPKGWVILEKEKIEDGYFISLSKGSSGGSVTINWSNEIFFLGDCIDVWKEEVRDTVGLFSSNLAFSKFFKSKFNNYNAVSSGYKCNFMGSEAIGICYVFVSAGMTFIITRNYSKTEELENKEGFEKIENSFEVE